MKKIIIFLIMSLVFISCSIQERDDAIIIKPYPIDYFQISDVDPSWSPIYLYRYDSTTFSIIVEGGIPPYTYMWYCGSDEFYRVNKYDDYDIMSYRFDYYGDYIISVIVEDNCGCTVEYNWMVEVLE